MPRTRRRTTRHLGRAVALAILGPVGCGGNSGPPSTPAPSAGPRASQVAIDATLDAAERLVQSGNLAEAEIVAARLCERGGGGAAFELHGRVLAGLAAQAEARGDQDEANTLRRRAWD
ncbi:MAG: hypothetical protein KDA22_03495, partial [Phycisphaerales bacterium]|nr:hypothetical protein [Phycisphaerales bacterium]